MTDCEIIDFTTVLQIIKEKQLFDHACTMYNIVQLSNNAIL